MELKFHIPQNEINYFRERLRKVDSTVRDRARKGVEASAFRIRYNAMKNSPHRTGRLKSSIKVDFTYDHLNAAIGTIVKYAIYVHEGTEPHIILPKNAKALRFIIGGKVIFAKKVNHPGTKANPFLKKAYDNEVPDFIQKMRTLLNG